MKSKSQESVRTLFNLPKDVYTILSRKKYMMISDVHIKSKSIIEAGYFLLKTMCALIRTFLVSRERYPIMISDCNSSKMYQGN